MAWSTVILIVAGMISLLILMGIIIFGTRKSNEFKEIEKTLGKRTKDLDSDAREIWAALKKSEDEKEKILDRLKNLEAIVTSEVWDSIQSGEDSSNIEIHLEDEDKEELSDAKKAAKIAKRIR